MELSNILIDALIGALIVVIAWLFFELQNLKSRVVVAVDQAVPPDWDWLVNDLARTFVKAAYQLFPPEQTAEMLNYVQKIIFQELTNRGVTLDEHMLAKIRGIIEAAVFDFYAMLGKPELTGF